MDLSTIFREDVHQTALPTIPGEQLLHALPRLYAPLRGGQGAPNGFDDFRRVIRGEKPYVSDGLGDSTHGGRDRHAGARHGLKKGVGKALGPRGVKDDRGLLIDRGKFVVRNGPSQHDILRRAQTSLDRLRSPHEEEGHVGELPCSLNDSIPSLDQRPRPIIHRSDGHDARLSGAAGPKAVRVDAGWENRRLARGFGEGTDQSSTEVLRDRDDPGCPRKEDLCELPIRVGREKPVPRHIAQFVPSDDQHTRFSEQPANPERRVGVHIAEPNQDHIVIPTLGGHRPSEFPRGARASRPLELNYLGVLPKDVAILENEGRGRQIDEQDAREHEVLLGLGAERPPRGSKHPNSYKVNDLAVDGFDASQGQGARTVETGDRERADWRSVPTAYGEAEELRHWASLAEVGLLPFEQHLVTTWIREGARVLVVGCGAGRETLALQKQGMDAVGLDISVPLVREAALRGPAGVHYLIGDAANLPFRKGAFDGILVFSQALAHIPGRNRRQSALRDMARVLRPGASSLVALNHRTLEDYSITYLLHRFLFSTRRSKRRKSPVSDSSAGTRRPPRRTDLANRIAATIVLMIRARIWRSRLRLRSARYRFLGAPRSGPESPRDFHMHILRSRTSFRPRPGLSYFHLYVRKEFLEDLAGTGLSVAAIHSWRELNGDRLPSVLSEADFKFVYVLRRDVV